MFGSLLFAKSKIYYTEQGKSVKEQIIGFRKYLQTVEQEKLDHLLREDPSYFEKVLPYAIALGVGKEWVKRCKAMITSLEYQVMDTNATLVVSDSLSRSMSWSSPSSSSSGSSSFGSSSSSSGGGSSGGG